MMTAGSRTGRLSLARCAVAILALTGLASATIITREVDLTSPMTISWDAPTAFDLISLRLPTGTSRLWSCSITLTSGGTINPTLTRGFPYQVILERAPRDIALTTLSSTATLVSLHDNPEKPDDHYLTFGYFDSPITLQITLQVIGVEFSRLLTADFTVFNMTIINTGAPGIVLQDVARRYADSTFNPVYIYTIPHEVGNWAAYPVYRVGSVEVDRPATLIPGVEYRYRVQRTLPSGSSDVAVIASVATLPTEVNSGVLTQITLTAFKHRVFALRLNSAIGISALNNDISFAMTGAAAAGDRIDVFLSEKLAISYGSTLTTLTGAAPTANLSLPCGGDFSKGVVYATLVYIPAAITLDQIRSQMRQMSVELILESTVVDPPALLPSVNVQLATTGSTAHTVGFPFSLPRPGGTVVVLKSDTGALRIDRREKFFSLCNAPTNRATTQRVDACLLSKGAGFDSILEFRGPGSFNYSFEAPFEFSTAPSTFNFAISATAVGPATEASYPMVVTSATTLSTGQVTLYSVFKNERCPEPPFVIDPPQSSPVCRETSGNPCTQLLLCPNQALRFKLSDPDASAQTSITSVTQIARTVVMLPDVASTGPHTVEANSRFAIVINTQTGMQYKALISSADAITVDLFYYAGGCDGSSLSVKETTSNGLYLHTVILEKSGTLMLTAGSSQMTYNITFEPFTPVGCVNPSTLSIPNLCSNRAAASVISTKVNEPFVQRDIVRMNNTFGFLFPAEYQTSGSCYNAFMVEACKHLLPPCDSLGRLDTKQMCPNLCAARMVAAGCTDPKVLHLCQFQSSSCSELGISGSTQVSAPPQSGTNNPPQTASPNTNTLIPSAESAPRASAPSGGAVAAPTFNPVNSGSSILSSAAMLVFVLILSLL